MVCRPRPWRAVRRWSGHPRRWHDVHRTWGHRGVAPRRPVRPRRHRPRGRSWLRHRSNHARFGPHRSAPNAQSTRRGRRDAATSAWHRQRACRDDPAERAYPAAACPDRAHLAEPVRPAVHPDAAGADPADAAASHPAAAPADDSAAAPAGHVRQASDHPADAHPARDHRAHPGAASADAAGDRRADHPTVGGDPVVRPAPDGRRADHRRGGRTRRANSLTRSP